MVVGGGISGIQAALDLATAGFKVFLVEKSPTIGGKMAQLDKTFPTNDCSMCIESPKFIECDRHPNIEILTYTEVDERRGRGGRLHGHADQEAALRQRGQVHRLHHLRRVLPGPDPRSVQPGPVARTRRSTSTSRRPCRSSPTSTSSCLYLEGREVHDLRGRLQERRHRPPPDSREKVEVKVGAIVLSPGLRAPSTRGRAATTATARIENVVTSLDFERLLCATGPARGRDPAPVRQEAPAQDRLDPLRRLAAGARRAATATARRCAARTPRSR